MLHPQPDQVFFDGTVGLGGHAQAILARILPEGRLLAMDRDCRNLDLARQRLGQEAPRVLFVQDSFARANHYAPSFPPFDGCLLDLGFSSAHVGDPGRGFSFLSDGPLDMRYDTRQAMTAAQVVNEAGVEELEEIFWELGEEKRAQAVAEAIVAARSKQPIATTVQLTDIVATVVPRQGKLHPATRTFQALRMAVNDELGELGRGLPVVAGLLKPGGRLAVITFHSLEDRLVKQWIRSQEDAGMMRRLNKHVIKPTYNERLENPRSRSAKLRVAEKL